MECYTKYLTTFIYSVFNSFPFAFSHNFKFFGLKLFYFVEGKKKKRFLLSFKFIYLPKKKSFNYLKNNNNKLKKSFYAFLCP